MYLIGFSVLAVYSIFFSFENTWAAEEGIITIDVEKCYASSANVSTFTALTRGAKNSRLKEDLHGII